MSAITGFITATGINYVLDMVGAGEFPVPSYFVALTNSVPTPYTSGDELDEINAVEYTRAEYDNVSGAWLVSGAVLSNVFEIDFPVATNDWGTARGWALCDALMGGRFLWGGPLPTPLAIPPANQATFAPGALTISIPVPSWAQSA